MGAKTGRLALIKASGDALVFTNEATTNVGGDNKTYRVTSSSKRVWDRSVVIVVKDGGVAVDPVADPYSVNRLTGVVLFVSATARVITVSGSYLPMTTVAKAKSYRYTLTAQNLSDASFGAVFNTRTQSLKDASGQLGKWFDILESYFNDVIQDEDVFVVLEFWSDSAAAYDIRIWATLEKDAISTSVESLIEEMVDFSGMRDADGRVVSL